MRTRRGPEQLWDLTIVRVGPEEEDGSRVLTFETNDRRDPKSSPIAWTVRADATGHVCSQIRLAHQDTITMHARAASRLLARQVARVYAQLEIPGLAVEPPRLNTRDRTGADRETSLQLALTGTKS